jgi:hypothetical protein
LVGAITHALGNEREAINVLAYECVHGLIDARQLV